MAHFLTVLYNSTKDNPQPGHLSETTDHNNVAPSTEGLFPSQERLNSSGMEIGFTPSRLITPHYPTIIYGHGRRRLTSRGIGASRGLSHLPMARWASSWLVIDEPWHRVDSEGDVIWDRLLPRLGCSDEAPGYKGGKMTVLADPGFRTFGAVASGKAFV